MSETSEPAHRGYSDATWWWSAGRCRARRSSGDSRGLKSKEEVKTRYQHTLPHAQEDPMKTLYDASFDAGDVAITCIRLWPH